MIIRIKNLRLQAFLGINEWERENKQDIIINLAIEFDGRAAALSDNIEDTVDYKALKKQIIDFVEVSRFQLIERMVKEIAEIVLRDEKARKVTIEIDKPHALRYADSVSMEYTVEREIK